VGQDVFKMVVGEDAAASPKASSEKKESPPTAAEKKEPSSPPPPPPQAEKKVASSSAPPPPPAEKKEATDKKVASEKKESPPTPSETSSSRSSVPTRTERREPMNRMRLRIAERLKSSQNTYALLTTFQEADMSKLVKLRDDFKDEFLKKHQVKLGFMSAFVKASSVALLEQPVVNAVISGDEIIYRDYVDISVAVATPKGLLTPVLRNTDRLSFSEIEREIANLGEKARKGQITLEDLAGGTFTISNGGVYGSLMGTPIVNPPQSAILGMHGITKRAVVVEGDRIEVRPMMYLALTYDHRLIDGREAVTFLRKIKAVVEDPRRLLLDLF